MDLELYNKINNGINPFNLYESELLDLVIRDDVIVIRLGIRCIHNKEFFPIHYTEDAIYSVDLKIYDYKLKNIRFKGSDFYSYDKHPYLYLKSNKFIFRIRDKEVKVDLLLEGTANRFEWIPYRIYVDTFANESELRILRRRENNYYGRKQKYCRSADFE